MHFSIWIQCGASAFVAIAICRSILSISRGLRHANKLKGNGQSCRGSIVDYQIEKDQDGNSVYRSIIEFRTLNDTRRVVEAPATQATMPEVRKAVTVYYAVDDADDFYIDEGLQPRWAKALIVILVLALVGIMWFTFYILQNPDGYIDSWNHPVTLP